MEITIHSFNSSSSCCETLTSSLLLVNDNDNADVPQYELEKLTKCNGDYRSAKLGDTLREEESGSWFGW
ncbi:uncharacterized protein KGF55_005376 [Candida pseudojiufengensis]|uniref:uncharacterized protein n=1 Tax=Candida pseudojiufengensis TaxID=497109 RepID=UPI00222514DC|nr:uncharacterized protein KGF55_005376 [Candida pseudojiufengensis]KAI5959399.1 hypothetical protein KGF55_005376 [Candida pseudojiufengensis]